MVERPVAATVGEAVAGALRVAALGVRVVPVWSVIPTTERDGAYVCACPDRAACTSPGKHPIEAGWQRIASTDPRRIEHWVKLFGDCNFGALGDDLIMADCDPKNGGALANRPDWLPRTNYVVATGGGGWHLGFAPPDGVAVGNAKLQPGWDLKATGGYVVCPGSLHVSGRRYRLVSCPDEREALVPWPADTYSEVTPAPGEPGTRSHLSTLLEHPAQVGDRNNWLASVAGHYAKAFDHRDAYDLHVRQAAALLSQTLEDSEIAKTADSIWSKERTKPVVTGSWTPYDLADFVRHPPGPPARFGPADMLYRGEVHWLAGEPESGKSILAYAACVDEMKAEHTVMILDEDAGVRDAATKLAALGATAEQLGEFMVYLPPTGRDLFKDWNQLTALIVAHRPSIVVVDAAADHLAASGKDEDKARDVTVFINRVLKPLAHEHGACVVAIDHKTKAEPEGRYAVGSRAKLAKSEVGYNVAAPETFNRSKSGRLHVVCTKDKPGWIGRDTSWMINVLVHDEGARITLAAGPALSAEDTKQAVRGREGGDDRLADKIKQALSESMLPMTNQELIAAIPDPPTRTRISRVLNQMRRDNDVVLAEAQAGAPSRWCLP